MLSAFAVLLFSALPTPTQALEATHVTAPSRQKAASDSNKANTEKAVLPTKEDPGAKRDETHTGLDPNMKDQAEAKDEKAITPAQKTAAIKDAEAIAKFNADKVVGHATPWEMYYQPASSPIMTEAEKLHDMVLAIITAITLFVLALLLYVITRFNKKKNPVPKRFTHNKLIEVIWTVIPIMILVIIAIPSLRLHYQYYNNETIISNPDLTIKVVGHQWYWSYEYPDQGIAFDANIKADNELDAGEPRLLAVDNPIVVPVNKVVRIEITSADVIHAWAIPAYGIKKGAVPGRLNETWFKAEKEGIYYGQCSVLCGKSHGFMPITIVVVSDEEFARWVKGAKLKFASNELMQFAQAY